MIATKKQRKNRNLQLFFTIVLYACCTYKILMGETSAIFCFQNELFYRLSSIFLLTINAIALLFVMRRQGLIELRNYQPALFYLLLSFVFSAVLNPLSLFVGLIFILGIFQNLFDFEDININSKIFRYGFYVGILALLYFPLILLLLLIYWACITYRRFSFRILLLPIISAILPFLYWYSALYIIGIEVFIQEDILQIGKRLLEIQHLNLLETPFILIFSILLLLVCLKSVHTLLLAAGKTSVLRRKKYYILLLLFLFSATFAILYGQFYFEILFVVCAIIISLHFVYAKKWWW